MCVLSLCTTVVNNTAHNSSDTLPSYHNHNQTTSNDVKGMHCQDVICDSLVHILSAKSAAAAAAMVWVGVDTKEVDVDLLQVVNTAELVELVMNLVVDERFVVVGRVVAHDVVHWQVIIQTAFTHIKTVLAGWPESRREKIPWVFQAYVEP